MHMLEHFQQVLPHRLQHEDHQMLHLRQHHTTTCKLRQTHIARKITLLVYGLELDILVQGPTNKEVISIELSLHHRPVRLLEVAPIYQVIPH